MSLEDKAVGRRIRILRDEAGLSQRDISSAGASYAYISRIESGERRASWSALVRIAEKLGTTALFLRTGDEEATCPICLRPHRDD